MVKNRKNGQDNVKVVPELGANAKGEQQGGSPVEMTDPNTSQVSYFVGSATPVGVVNTNLPDDEELTVSFGIQNGEAAAKTMTIDYVNVICER